MSGSILSLQTFMDEWAETDERNKEAFIELKSHLEAMDGVETSFNPRPGVTYSLRAGHQHQVERDLFVMVDVIEDTPRWLSICFYGEMIADPDDLGDFVPEGLLGEDAMCFDIDTYDEKTLKYVKDRIGEAYRSVRGA